MAVNRIGPIFILLLGAFPAGAAEETTPLWLTSRGTQPPRFYLFWQSGDPHNATVGRIIREVRPDLLQDGGARRPHGSHRPGPDVAFGGWAYEKDDPRKKPESPTGPTFFTPAEYARRLAEGKAEIDYRLGRLGVHGTCPYVCAVKIDGDRQRRLGFWAFYDRWDDYAQFGFGPKPDVDPWDWIQRATAGGPRHMWAFYKPDADGSRIYSGCPNSPFSRYLANLVRLGAKNGDRGVFVDNPGVDCVCPWCQQAWGQYLRERFPPAELKRCFGIDRYEDAQLGRPPFQLESLRFRSYAEGHHLARMREAGESVCGRGNFWIVPNGAGIGYQPNYGGCDPLEWARAGGFQIGTRECNRVIEGHEQRALTGGLRLNEADDLILGHKMMRGIGSAQVWAGPLRSSYLLGNDANMYNLAAAETLAFDGVLCDTGPFWCPTAARVPFVRFYRHFEGLLRSGPGVADVAVLSMTNDAAVISDTSQPFASPADSTREVRVVTDWLSEARVQWADLMDDNVTPASLAPYEAVFVPHQRMLDDDQVAALKAYLRGGGTLFLSGPCGTGYRRGARRLEPAFADVLPEAPRDKPFAVAACGRGRVAWCPKGFSAVELPAAYRGSDTQAAQPARGLIEAANRGTFLACLDAALGHGLSSIRSPGPRAVRIASRWFKTADDAATMTVHLANYDLRAATTQVYIDRVLTAPTELRPATDLRVAVPVPRGWHATGVKIAALPDTRQTAIALTPFTDGLGFSVPVVASYSFAAVELAPGPGAARETLADARGRHTSSAGTLPIIELEPHALRPRPAIDRQPAGVAAPLGVVPGVPVTFDAEKGGQVELHLRTTAGTSSDEVAYMQDAVTDGATVKAGSWLRFWLLSPSGRIALAGAVPAAQATHLRLPAEESGLYVLVTEPGPGKLFVASPSRFLMAVAQPLVIEQSGQRMYFFVPAGATQLKLAPRTNLGSYAGRMRVFAADGHAVVDRETVNVHPIIDTIPVPPGQAGKAWSIQFDTPGAVRFTVDLGPPLGGYAAMDPARLAVFAQ